jgi:hypothetical protein
MSKLLIFGGQSSIWRLMLQVRIYRNLLINMVGAPGLEPGTNGLKGAGTLPYFQLLTVKLTAKTPSFNHLSIRRPSIVAVN